MQVKAIACELPKESGQPLSRYSGQDLVRAVVQRGLVAKISGRTIWRWLDEDAIRPWQHRSWIFPRDPDFQSKAERVLDLYQGQWNGQPLGPGDYVISADEKTSIQARLRLHPTLPPGPETRRLPPLRRQVSAGRIRAGGARPHAALPGSRAHAVASRQPHAGPARPHTRHPFAAGSF